MKYFLACLFFTFVMAGAVRAEGEKDSLFFYTADTADFNPAFLTLYSDGTFDYFQMPGGSCWAALDEQGTWTKNGNTIELHFPPRIATGTDGDTIVYDDGICKLQLKEELLVCPKESNMVVNALRAEGSIERFFGQE